MASMIETAANDNGDAALAALQAAFGRALDAQLVAGSTFGAREAAGLALANALCRADQERDLARRAENFSRPAVIADGVEYRRHALGTVRYHGLCGELRVTRYTFRQVGLRNGPTIVPLELDAGLMKRATPALAYAILEGHALSDSRELETRMKTSHRLTPSRSTTERIAKGLGKTMAEAVPRIEPVLRAEERLPDGV